MIAILLISILKTTKLLETLALKPFKANSNKIIESDNNNKVN